mmetsp:Transcript_19671/g.51721  ORF Transcript_19671/g.51721 Transcript_19671/m.51721 type:complete len:104 (+) Transcript_19671:45-356(+)
MQVIRDVNAQVREALLISSLKADVPHVVLISFSGKPRAFRTTLLEDARLADCRDASSIVLPSGAKVLVQPEQCELLIDAGDALEQFQAWRIVPLLEDCLWAHA